MRYECTPAVHKKPAPPPAPFTAVFSSCRDSGVDFDLLYDIITSYQVCHTLVYDVIYFEVAVIRYVTLLYVCISILDVSIIYVVVICNTSKYVRQTQTKVLIAAGVGSTFCCFCLVPHTRCQKYTQFTSLYYVLYYLSPVQNQTVQPSLLLLLSRACSFLVPWSWIDAAILRFFWPRLAGNGRYRYDCRFSLQTVSTLSTSWRLLFAAAVKCYV